MIEVLYEDNHIIAVNKKPSDIVQGDKTGDKPLPEFVKDYIKKKHPRARHSENDIYLRTMTCTSFLMSILPV